MKNLSLALAFTMIASAVFAQNVKSSNVSPSQGYEPLMWEHPKKNERGQTIEKNESYEKRLVRSPLWSLKVYEVIKNEAQDLINTVPADADVYCPNYAKLSKDKRANFWGQLIAAISFRESGWNPTDRMIEKSFKRPDAVTSKQVYSEGLMQLSYQDELTYQNKFDCMFDYNKDKKLAVTDSNKTIFAPYRNLRCAILILNNHIKNNKRITTKGVYWSVIRPRAVNKYSKTMWIAKQTQSLSFCGKTKTVQNWRN